VLQFYKALGEDRVGLLSGLGSLREDKEFFAVFYRELLSAE
jgi:hypothetical protein